MISNTLESICLIGVKKILTRMRSNCLFACFYVQGLENKVYDFSKL
jgi:hypothetical protein